MKFKKFLFNTIFSLYTVLLYCMIIYYLFHPALQKPATNDLLNYVNPHISHKWMDVGILLAIPLSKLKEIEKDHGSDMESSCIRMLVQWSHGESATWKKLLSVIDLISKHIEPIEEEKENLSITLDYYRAKGTVHRIKQYLLYSIYKDKVLLILVFCRGLDTFSYTIMNSKVFYVCYFSDFKISVHAYKLRDFINLGI